MPKLHVDFHSSLDPFDQETLDEITADGHTFASAGWYRMLSRVNLSEITGGKVELRFAVVRCEDMPVCLCPILRTSGDGIYFVYSLRKFFFEHWIEEAVRMNPDQEAHYGRLSKFVTAFRQGLQWTGSKLDECLIVTNPLSYRGHIPVAPSAPCTRAEIYGALVDLLKIQAQREKLPLWFLGVEEEDRRLMESLTDSKAAPSFLFYDNRIELDGLTSFDDYLQRFRRTTRRAFARDIRRTTEAGVEIDFMSEIDECADQLTALYGETYRKYGESYFQQPPSFWRALKRELGSSVEAVTARYEGRLIGFSVLLHSERRGEMFTYRIGRSNDAELADCPYYFSLSFYGPIQRAIERGYRRIWLGPASYEAKGVRGAQQVPLWSFFWFPRRIDRWCLAPYLKLFGKISREEIEKSIGRPLRTITDVGSNSTRSLASSSKQ